jgi:uncharacterized membrane protein
VIRPPRPFRNRFTRPTGDTSGENPPWIRPTRPRRTHHPSRDWTTAGQATGHASRRLIAHRGWLQSRTAADHDHAHIVARLDEILRYLRESLWFIPAILAAASLLLAAVLLLVDAHVGDIGTDIPLIYEGSVEGAREVLATIAISMLTFTGLVFSITMLVLQSASNQLSPRVLRTFLRDRGNQVVLGLFIATFLFALVVLRYTRSAGENEADELVPGLSVSVAFLLLIGSIGAFIYYIDHMAHAIRASTVIHNIAAETRQVMENLFPEPYGDPEEPGEGSEAEGPSDNGSGGPAVVPKAAPTAKVVAPSSGVLVGVDEKGLLKAALLGRLNVVPYYPISDTIMRQITELKLSKIKRRIEENHRAEFVYDNALVNAVASRCTEVDSGARNVDHIINRSLLPEMSREFLSRMANGQGIGRVRINVDEQGGFLYEIA